MLIMVFIIFIIYLFCLLAFAFLANYLISKRRNGNNPPAPDDTRRDDTRQSAKKRRYKAPDCEYDTIYRKALEQTHLLIGGVTGAGKSVFIDGMIGVIMSRLPLTTHEKGANIILIDPKGTELDRYKSLPHCLAYADGDSDMIGTLEQALELVKERFRENKVAGRRKYIGSDVYVIVDELAYLVWQNKRRAENAIRDIAALGRAAKVHLVLATQTPRSDVISKALTANIDATIGLKTSSRRESNILLGGTIDGFAGLQTLPEPRTEHRAQCYFKAPSIKGLYNVPMVAEAELDRLVNYWEEQVA